MSGVICDRRVPARLKGEVGMCRPYKVRSSETSNVVRVGDGGTDEKTGGGDGGGRVEDGMGIHVHQRDSTGGKV